MSALVLVAGCGPVEQTPGDCRSLTADEVEAGGELAAGCYDVAENLTVQSGTLVLAPGTTLRFERELSLTVAQGAQLSAVGTPEAPITLRGTDSVRGHWRGVRFQGSSGTANALSFVVLEDAGHKAWTGDGRTVAALYLDDSASVPLRNATFRRNAGAALMARGAPGTVVVEDSTFVDNALVAWVHPNKLGGFAASNTFSENDENVVNTGFTNNDAVEQAQTWAALSVPVRVMDRLQVEAPLTLGAGLVAHFTQGASLLVQGEGRLNAVGTAEAPIILQGTEPTAGYWRGISVETMGTDNVLEHVTVAHAASDAWSGNSDQRAMVHLGPSSSLAVRHVTFRQSAHYALWVPEGGQLTAFDQNTFEDNARLARVHPNRVGELSAVTASGNAESAVRVGFVNTNAVEDAQTWQALGVPYLVTERTYVEAPLTIAEGTTVRFLQDTSLRVQDGGTLRALGTAAAPVRFVGDEATSGFWQGVSVGTNSAQNLLQHASIEDAGSSAWTGNSASVAALYVGLGAEGRVALDQAAFRNSAGYGIYVADGAVDPCASPVFEATTDGEIFLGAQGSSTCP